MNTEQILFSEEATRKIRDISDGSTPHRTHLMLIGIRSGSSVWIQEILSSNPLGRYIPKEDSLANELDLRGRVRGYSYALERYTPYRHLGWVWFSHSDKLLTAPTEGSVEALIKHAHWRVNSSTRIWPLVVLTARERRKAVQLKAFEIREGQAVEVPVHLPFAP
ncbi:hypothetical protein E7T06_11365 [Deinococcus sp. Arct2-2]|uniref:hypothetical protein n=1 Tax=Deinococcus sp. Arct2-2 TaxID=2568653 RepID=UPI0010A50419|nr:hypothetical protein [Deinococcus sp. Arct2-2]THF69606.1 hypothetical protein E7T06_11365 [Deinococcus sp. Arct2-2]